MDGFAPVVRLLPFPVLKLRKALEVGLARGAVQLRVACSSSHGPSHIGSHQPALRTVSPNSGQNVKGRYPQCQCSGPGEGRRHQEGSGFRNSRGEHCRSTPLPKHNIS